MELNKDEEKIVKEYIEIQNEFKTLQNKMAKIKSESGILIKRLKGIRDKESDLFKKIDEKNK